jgi:hypothetical protein
MDTNLYLNSHNRDTSISIEKDTYETIRITIYDGHHVASISFLKNEVEQVKMLISTLTECLK